MNYNLHNSKINTLFLKFKKHSDLCNKKYLSDTKDKLKKAYVQCIAFICYRYFEHNYNNKYSMYN